MSGLYRVAWPRSHLGHSSNLDHHKSLEWKYQKMIASIMIALAVLAGGQSDYDVVEQDTVQAWSTLGEVAGCGEMSTPEFRETCVSAVTIEPDMPLIGDFWMP